MWDMSETPLEAADAVRTSAVSPANAIQIDNESVTIPVRLCSLPPLNAIANQVLTLSADPNIDLVRLSKVMECDPAFAADVLFLANSSLFGFPARINALRHAIAVLGLDRIKALAVTVAMRSYLAKGGPLIRQCWRHSAATAIIAQQLADAFRVTPETAYSVGLLHDIGRLGLLKSYSPDYTPVLNGAFMSVEGVLHAERAALNVDHAVAGSWLVKTWVLPSVFATVCEHHHERFSLNDAAPLQVIKLACRVAEALGFSAVRYDPAPDYDKVIQSLPKEVPVSGFPPAEELRATVEKRLAAFD